MERAIAQCSDAVGHERSIKGDPPPHRGWADAETLHGTNMMTNSQSKEAAGAFGQGAGLFRRAATTRDMSSSLTA